MWKIYEYVTIMCALSKQRRHFTVTCNGFITSNYDEYWENKETVRPLTFTTFFNYPCPPLNPPFEKNERGEDELM